MEVRASSGDPILCIAEYKSESIMQLVKFIKLRVLKQLVPGNIAAIRGMGFAKGLNC